MKNIVFGVLNSYIDLPFVFSNNSGCFECTNRLKLMTTALALARHLMPQPTDEVLWVTIVQFRDYANKVV